MSAPILLRPDGARGLRRVFIRDLVLDAGIGVYAHEVGVAQKLFVCLEALVREDPAAEQGTEQGVGEDRLGRVVDYDALAEAARAAVRAGHVRLIETVAERVAAGMLAADPRVVQVMVTIEKPGAVHDAAASGVTVERFRDG